MKTRVCVCVCLAVVIAAWVVAPVQGRAEKGKLLTGSTLSNRVTRRLADLQQRLLSSSFRNHVIAGDSRTTNNNTSSDVSASSSAASQSSVKKPDSSSRKASQSPPPSSTPVRTRAHEDDGAHGAAHAGEKDIALATSTCTELQQLGKVDAIVSRLGVDIRRLQYYQDVAPEEKDSKFKKGHSTCATKSTTWAIPLVSTLPGVTDFKGVAEVENFVKGLYEKPKLLRSFIEGVSNHLAGTGPDSSLIVFTDTSFGCLDSAIRTFNERLQLQHPTLDSIKSAMKALSEKWSSANSHDSNVANNPMLKTASWIGDSPLSSLDVCSPGVAEGAKSSQSVAGGDASDSVDLQSKLQFVMWRLFLMESLFTNENGFSFHPEAASGPASGSGGSNGGAKAAHPCDITSSVANHGCDSSAWCQFEFVFIQRHDLILNGKGFCMPRFDAHSAAEGSVCMDHSDCASSYCHMPVRLTSHKHKDGAGAALVGTCRVAVPIGTPDSELVDHSRFNIKKLSAKDAQNVAGSGVTTGNDSSGSRNAKSRGAKKFSRDSTGMW